MAPGPCDLAASPQHVCRAIRFLGLSAGSCWPDLSPVTSCPGLLCSSLCVIELCKILPELLSVLGSSRPGEAPCNASRHSKYWAIVFPTTLARLPHNGINPPQAGKRPQMPSPQTLHPCCGHLPQGLIQAHPSLWCPILTEITVRAPLP